MIHDKWGNNNWDSLERDALGAVNMHPSKQQRLFWRFYDYNDAYNDLFKKFVALGYNLIPPNTDLAREAIVALFPDDRKDEFLSGWDGDWMKPFAWDFSGDIVDVYVMQEAWYYQWAINEGIDVPDDWESDVHRRMASRMVWQMTAIELIRFMHQLQGQGVFPLEG